jgi:hypothetical protein
LATHLLGFFGEQPDAIFLRSRNEKPETIEQTARTDSHRFSGNSTKRHLLDELGGGGGGPQPFGNCRKRVLFSRHERITW